MFSYEYSVIFAKNYFKEHLQKAASELSCSRNFSTNYILQKL